MNDHETARQCGSIGGILATMGSTVYAWLSGHGFFSAPTFVGMAGLALTFLVHLDKITANWRTLRGWIRSARAAWASSRR